MLSPNLAPTSLNLGGPGHRSNPSNAREKKREKSQTISAALAGTKRPLRRTFGGSHRTHFLSHSENPYRLRQIRGLESRD